MPQSEMQNPDQAHDRYNNNPEHANFHIQELYIQTCTETETFRSAAGEGTMQRFPATTIISMAVFITQAHAGPIVHAETTEYFAGTFLQGQVDTISHRFIMTNPGDEPLYILKVHPGCGCTKFDVDKKIGPGDTGSIVIKVDVSQFKGLVKKTTSVLTDADNEQLVRFVMKARIEPVITLTDEFIKFGPADSRKTVGITTNRDNFSVNSVYYKAYITGSKHLVAYSLTKDSVQDGDGTVNYTLKLRIRERPPQTSPGSFIISTNHPQKKRVEAGGLIEVSP
ncbi:MAG: DUF1573 domain-containing protein [Chitinivibrionales bacterium]|nr:DUF1573 domain-containing protein [Chitinivibrionales bacterium]